jgi:hypothetical protein
MQFLANSINYLKGIKLNKKSGSIAGVVLISLVLLSAVGYRYGSKIMPKKSNDNNFTLNE